VLLVKRIAENAGGTAWDGAGHAEPVEIWKARRLIEEQGGEALSLTMVAEAVSMSPNYLSEKFRRVTGENFVAYINRRRVQKARHLLHESKLRISEIAFAVGFQSLSQFNRIFKQQMGKSPTAVRAEKIFIKYA